ncbi:MULTISPECIES: MerR family transcriptional regulator [Streptomyces]|uniref:PP2C-family Ser/Thr phosphatase n=1 Tax=Streptomyces malaysiensis TaxID=92644 RepID=A0A2J7YRJ5_STRMQ|nr:MULTISPECIES: MerR family transcriptional regulator [Streptomyces]MCD9588226.1 MerR family transcriptional regulator [Streptomyces sp. 8ZJF_21]PNG90641.1 PP2C-family Ser/Thr phosphatase [Streptomyces malaysiensis]
MGLLTIGAFARASRLSPKALRLYDELGLLPPARVDPYSGYRRYDPAQLERARLVAWLRRLGMPLADIRAVCELAPEAAAREVRAYWARVEADTAARRDLAAFLVDHLSGKDTTMSSDHPTLGIRYAVLSDTGSVRESNDDAGYAGPRLLAVADGFGGGRHAGEAAIEALKPLDAGVPGGELLSALEEAAHRARESVSALAASDPTLRDVGTTLTAMVWSGSRLGLVHIGDSRAYLLRDGELFQITHDHTVVQSLIDEGRITPEEAASHPQRALLLRAMGGGSAFEPDFALRDARAEDRYLLCSDGLTGVVPTGEIRRVLASEDDPGRAVRELVALANRAGGPDNVTCVVAHVAEQGALTSA